ncbi:MAG: pilus assembly PilX N-terminal domain-containing protein [Filifactor alocis]|nr:pilus assembly PilX N-terminal domain-containing protein [Filifactor alocis]
MKNKQKGFIFFSVLILMILLTSVSTSMLAINSVHARNIAQDKNRNEAYYIANAGLEMVFSALNKVDSSGNSIIIQDRQNYIDDQSKPESARVIKERSNILVSSPNPLYLETTSGEKFGRITLYADLKKGTIPLSSSTTLDTFYYRIVSTGTVVNPDGSDLVHSSPENTHTLTMFVYLDDPNNPKIYNGNRENP